MREGYVEAVQKAAALGDTAEEYQGRINELALQLAECGAKEHAHLREQARLKGEIARLRYAPPAGQSPHNPILP